MFSNDQFRNTAELVREVNERLCENSIAERRGFITLFYAPSTRPGTHDLEFAGHPLAILQNSSPRRAARSAPK